MSFVFLVEIYIDSLLQNYKPYILSLSQSQPSRAFFYILCSLSTPYQEETFPRVSLSCTCFLALSIGMFHCLEIVFLSLTLVSSYLCTIKHFYSFSSFSKYLKKSKKKSKNIKSWTGKYVIFGGSRVMSLSNRELYITSIGWVSSLTLGAILISMSLPPPTG